MPCSILNLSIEHNSSALVRLTQRSQWQGSFLKLTHVEPYGVMLRCAVSKGRRDRGKEKNALMSCARGRTCIAGSFRTLKSTPAQGLAVPEEERVSCFYCERGAALQAGVRGALAGRGVGRCCVDGGEEEGEEEGRTSVHG